MLKTKSDFIEYLATKGITLAVANDCWLEYLAEGPDGDQQLWQDGAPIELHLDTAFNIYRSFADSVEVKADGIYFDDELHFDVNGNHF
jgi:hypothetical protein